MVGSSFDSPWDWLLPGSCYAGPTLRGLMLALSAQLAVWELPGLERASEYSGDSA